MKKFKSRFITVAAVVCTALGMLSIAPSANAAHNHSESTYHANPTTPLDLGAGFILSQGSTYPGLDVQLATRISSELPVYAGGEFGLFFNSGPGYTNTVVPILGTIFAKFHASRRVHPMFGVSAGPSIASGFGRTNVSFGLLMNPGVRFSLGRTTELVTQVRLGVLDAAFVVLPQVALSFPI